MLRIATVGSGKIVSLFLKGLKTVPECVHTAIYSRTRARGEEFAAECGLSSDAVWTDLEEMAKSQTIDAVYLATPNRFHARQAKILLENGVHVLCEKPATVSPEELRELQTIAQKQHVIFLEAIMAPHQPRFAILQKEVQKLGKLSGAELNFSQYSSRYPAFLRGEHPNIFNREMCAGALMDIGVYDVYLALALFGFPQKVYASAHFLPGGADGAGSAVFTYPWGDCLLNWSKTAQSRAPSEILGDEGTITFSPVSRILEIRRWETDGSSTLLFDKEPHEISLSNEARDFARYILFPEETAEEYVRMCKLSRDGAEMMEEIRRQAGISFDAPEK